MAVYARLKHHEKWFFTSFTMFFLRVFKWVPVGDILENWG